MCRAPTLTVTTVLTLPSRSRALAHLNTSSSVRSLPATKRNDGVSMSSDMRWAQAVALVKAVGSATTKYSPWTACTVGGQESLMWFAHSRA